MSNESMRSVGTFGALAALCAVDVAEGAVVFSSTVSNVPIVSGGDVFLDLDGDTVQDFEIYGNHFFVQLEGLSSNEMVVSGPGVVQTMGSGDSVHAGLSYQQFAVVHQAGDPSSPSASGSFSVGFHFIAQDAQLHYGWFNFEFPAGNTSSLAGAKLISAAWESNANTAVNIIAIPETNSYLAVAGIGLGLWALGRKQKSFDQPCY